MIIIHVSSTEPPEVWGWQVVQPTSAGLPGYLDIPRSDSSDSLNSYDSRPGKRSHRKRTGKIHHAISMGIHQLFQWPWLQVRKLSTFTRPGSVWSMQDPQSPLDSRGANSISRKCVELKYNNWRVSVWNHEKNRIWSQKNPYLGVCSTHSQLQLAIDYTYNEIVWRWGTPQLFTVYDHYSNWGVYHGIPNFETHPIYHKLLLHPIIRNGWFSIPTFLCESYFISHKTTWKFTNH